MEGGDVKTYDEIKDIIVNQLGLTDLTAYKAWCDEFAGNSPRIPVQADIDLLSPDEIDNNAFWRIAEVLFQTDPVSNCNGVHPVSVDEANRRNMAIYHTDGFTGLVEALKISGWTSSRLLEVGPGYGAFKYWLSQAALGWTYYAADCYPRIGGVDATELNGRLAAQTKARTYDVVIASNVFQHLSVAQRRAYYADIAASLAPGGIFMVSQMVDCHPRGSLGRDALGRYWCRHYGQFTEIQNHPAIADDLRVHFNVQASSIRDNRWAVFTCQKRQSAALVSPAII